MKRVLPALASAACAAALVVVPAANAQALAVSDRASCPSGRYVATYGSALGYVYVLSGNNDDLARSSTNARVNRTVKSYRTSDVLWRVSSGSGDSEVPVYRNSCNNIT